MTDKQREALQSAIRETMEGINNAYKSVVLNGDFGSLPIGDDLDDKAFLEKSDKLEQAIAIGLNIPYDVLKSVNSNKASASVAISTMYKQLIEPMQSRVLVGLKELFTDFEQVENLQFRKIDNKDLAELVSAITSLVDRGVITRAEARQDLNYKQRNETFLDQFSDDDTARVDGDDDEVEEVLDNQNDDVQDLYSKNPKEQEA